MKKNEVITLGAGCFWCIEAVLKELKGVQAVLSGYTGGVVAYPTYRDVCTGTTGHAEVAQITFNPSIISIQEILEVFFSIHDPTTLNQQGYDVGSHYRSAIFYSTEEQKNIALEIISNLNKNQAYPKDIVTEVTPLNAFYVAESYHQDFLANNSENAYCQMIVRPKLEQFRLAFANKLQA